MTIAFDWDIKQQTNQVFNISIGRKLAILHLILIPGSFRATFCITEEDGGMTDLARIMIRDCKYDVSTNSSTFLVNLIQEKI